MNATATEICATGRRKSASARVRIVAGSGKITVNDEAFEKYKSGFIVRLRQILNYEFLEHDANYRSYFNTDSFSCDTNTSSATFKPHKPYGKKDYDVEFHLNCSK